MDIKALPEVALLYDFDRTLCTADMQEYTFIPGVGMDSADFWHEADALADGQHMDRVLAYMYLMLRKARAAELPVRRSDFTAHGRHVEFFPGVADGWFARTRRYGLEHGVRVEHYIISSGLGEIIEGTPIADEFREIFACRFHYDPSGVADWPLVAVNYTGKTQFLFRINKGVLDVSDDRRVNDWVPEDERPVPFRRMIYFSDGMTDVPCMKLVKNGGGAAVAVYRGDTSTADRLIRTGRVDYTAPADYREGGMLDTLTAKLISLIALNDSMISLSRNMKSVKGKG